jgi:uncharacterized membrane protein YphA (DoxX/SURF4 family)
MKIAVMVARILLGLIFFVFGLNGFLHFMPNPPPTPAAGAFFGALIATGYMFSLVFLPQVLGGALLLLNIAVPFALVILAPVIVNIILFHIYLSPVPMQLAIAFIVAAFELFLAWYYRANFAPLFTSTPRS